MERRRGGGIRKTRKGGNRRGASVGRLVKHTAWKNLSVNFSLKFISKHLHTISQDVM